MKEEAVHFFASEPQRLSLCLKLLDALDEALETYEIRQSRTQLSLYSGCMFGCISYPRAKKQPGLLVTFGLPVRAVSERIWQAVEVYPERWTHHVMISAESQIDEELIGWLAAAQIFAQHKKKR